MHLWLISRISRWQFHLVIWNSYHKNFVAVNLGTRQFLKFNEWTYYFVSCSKISHSHTYCSWVIAKFVSSYSSVACFNWIDAALNAFDQLFSFRILKIFHIFTLFVNICCSFFLGDRHTVYTILKLIPRVTDVLLCSYRVKILLVFAEPDDWAYVQQTRGPHWISAGLFVEGTERRNRFSNVEKVPRPTENTSASDSLFVKRT